MPKVSFRMASASRESVFGIQTNAARKDHRSDHIEGRLTTAPSGCRVRKGTTTGTADQVSAAGDGDDWRANLDHPTKDLSPAHVPGVARTGGARAGRRTRRGPPRGPV